MAFKMNYSKEGFPFKKTDKEKGKKIHPLVERSRDSKRYKPQSTNPRPVYQPQASSTKRGTGMIIKKK